MEKEILFRKGVKLQKLNRVALPSELLDNLGIGEGDNLSIFYDTENECIVIKKDKKGGKN